MAEESWPQGRGIKGLPRSAKRPDNLMKHIDLLWVIGKILFHLLTDLLKLPKIFLFVSQFTNITIIEVKLTQDWSIDLKQ